MKIRNAMVELVATAIEGRKGTNSSSRPLCWCTACESGGPFGEGLERAIEDAVEQAAGRVARYPQHGGLHSLSHDMRQHVLRRKFPGAGP